MKDTPTLAELLFLAERFCLRSEAEAAARPRSNEEAEELRRKLEHARGLVGLLQQAFDRNELSVRNATVCANFRLLMVALLWIAFYARDVVDHRLFRTLVLIESRLTYLLITGRG